jgi:hypothetical protein
MMRAMVTCASLLVVLELLYGVSKQHVVSRVVACVARRWRADVLRFRILINRALIAGAGQPESPGGALCFYGTFHYLGGSLEVNEVKTI